MKGILHERKEQTFAYLVQWVRKQFLLKFLNLVSQLNKFWIFNSHILTKVNTYLKYICPISHSQSSKLGPQGYNILEAQL